MGGISATQVWRWATALMVLGALLLVLSVTSADPDLWGHLRFGLDMLEDRHLTREDPYSYLSGPQPWINHEWLAELLFALAWQAAGPTGLILLKMAVGGAIIALLYAELAKVVATSLRAAVLVMLGLLLLLPALGTVRPHMFTLLGFSLTSLILLRAEKGDLHWLWAGPPLFALWVNLHGGVLAGLGLFCLWAMLHVMGDLSAWRQVLPPVFASLAATLVNPYGPTLPAFLLRTATVRRPEIVEWAPLQLNTALGAFYCGVFLVALLGLVYSRKTRRTPLLILFSLMALSPFVAVRHLPLFGIATLAFAGEHIGSAWDTIRPVRGDGYRKLPATWLAVLPAVLGLGLLIWMSTNLNTIPLPARSPRFPSRAVTLLKQAGVSGNLAVDFNWGQYVIWHLGPEVQVSMDGRRETVYSEKVYSQYWDFILGRGNWETILASYETDLVLVEPRAAAYHLLILSPGWDLVFEDQVSSLFQRQGSSSLGEPLLNAHDFEEVPGMEIFP